MSVVTVKINNCALSVVSVTWRGKAVVKHFSPFVSSKVLLCLRFNHMENWDNPSLITNEIQGLMGRIRIHRGRRGTRVLVLNVPTGIAHYLCKMERCEAVWAPVHPPKISLLNLSSSFPFFLSCVYQKQWKLLRQQNNHNINTQAP